MGTGAAALGSAATAAFLDEYTTTGALVQSIAMPTADSGAHQILTLSGTATSEGLITRSEDGSYLLVFGYDAATGTASITTSAPATINRVVGRVDSAGAIDTTTALTDPTGNARGATSTNGTDLWVTSSTRGSQYATLGSTTSIQVSSTLTNLRATAIFGGQLYVSSQSGAFRLSTVGTGTPTGGGNTIANLPGLPTGTNSPYQFFLADLDATVAGLDTLYFCDDNTTGTGGLYKYSLVSGTWAATGSATGSCRGLTGSVSGSTVTLYATGISTATGLQSITDSTGYNGTLTGSLATLAAAGTNTAFRSVAFAPVAPVVTNPDLTVSVAGSATAFNGINYNYTVTVANTGSTAATGVVAHFTLPVGVTFVSATGASGFTGANVAGVVQFTGGTVNGSSNVPLTVTVTPTAPTITVSPGDAIVDPGATVTETDEANNASTQTVTTTVGSITFISQVQGPGTASPSVGSAVAVEGIVTGYYPGLVGFFVQEEEADYDADPNTSEGIFVSSNAVVAVGDKVRVAGTVSESFNLTQLTSATVSTLSTGNTLPTAISLTLPMASTTDWEKHENMRVTLTQTLTVTETMDLAAFGEVMLSSNGRLYTPTGTIDPNDDPASGTTSTGSGNVPAVTAAATANVLNSIRLDDGAGVTNPATIPFWNSTDNTLRVGSTLAGPTGGILHYAFSTYRVLPGNALAFIDASPRPVTPPAVGAANLKVAAFNVLNYFNGNGAGGGFPTSRGANSAAEFARQRAKIIAAIDLLGADIVGLVEIENDGTTGYPALQDLVDGLNAVAGAGVWQLIADPAGYGSLPGGSDEIKTALIYKTAVVLPVGSASASADSAFSNARAPFAQTFQLVANGEKLTVVVNHFKSKGSGSGLDADQGDGQGASNHSRRLQAAALVTFVNSLVTSSGDPDVLLLGDFNAYDQEDPIDILRAAGYSTLGTSLYSYNFDGQSGSLDHAIATSSLVAQVTGADKWHINADEPVVLDYNVEGKNTAGCVTNCTSPDYYLPTPYRSSDHDPILVGLNLTPAATAPTAPQTLQGTAGNAQIVLTYTAPTSDGGSAITGYSASCTDGGTNNGAGSSVGAGLTITVGSLVNGVTYSCTVTATNAIGTGPASTAATGLRPSTVPGAPTNVQGTAGDATATITYLAPASNGGSAITGYTANCTGGAGATGNSVGAGLTITLNGLTNGTTYTCTVVASNANGSSVPSASVMVTPQQPSYALTVTKTGTGSGTVTSNPAGISCGATCAASFANGSSVTLTATPAGGSAIGSWTGCDSTTANTCTVAMTGDRNPTVSLVTTTTYNAVLEGWQQSPYVVTAAGGTVTATFNPATSQLTVDLQYSNLSSGETMAHIHGPAARGANAGVLIDLFPPTTSPRTVVVTLTAPQVTMLQNGQLYVNVHTATHTGGEIRGQIDNVGATVLRQLTVVAASLATGAAGSVSGTTEAGTVISCGTSGLGTDCTESIPDGKTVTLTATASAGSNFAGWTGAGCTGTGNCVVTMDAAQNVMARFDPPATASSTDLTASLSFAPTPAASAGKDVVFTMSVTNNGPGTESNAVVTLDTGPNMHYVWAAPGCSGNTTVTCNAGTLAAGASATFRVVLFPNASGSYAGSARASGSGSDPNSSNNLAVVSIPVNSTPAGVPVLRYRLYSPVTLEHLFTTDLNEYTVLGASGNWVQEGNVGSVLNNPGTYNGVFAVPYYRLYETGSRWHHWTTDANEYYTLIQYPNWNAEGVDGYILPTQAAGTTELYRLHYPFIPGLHHWTIDPVEYNALITQFGWVGEPGAGFVVP